MSTYHCQNDPIYALLYIYMCVCVQIFEGCNFQDFHGQLVIHEIFILKI